MSQAIRESSVLSDLKYEDGQTVSRAFILPLLYKKRIISGLIILAHFFY
jgi:hypothetical protein